MNDTTTPLLRSHPQALDVPWINQVLAYGGHSMRTSAMQSAPMGTGQTAHSERLSLTLEDGSGTLSMAGKFPSPDAKSKATGHAHSVLDSAGALSAAG